MQNAEDIPCWEAESPRVEQAICAFSIYWALFNDGLYSPARHKGPAIYPRIAVLLGLA
jgi:hypothetical protein